MAEIKQLKQNLSGGGGTPIFPKTSTDAVVDGTGKTLSQIISERLILEYIENAIVNSGGTFSFSMDYYSAAKAILFTTSGSNCDVYVVWRVNADIFFKSLARSQELVGLSYSGMNVTVTAKQAWINISVLIF